MIGRSVALARLRSGFIALFLLALVPAAPTAPAAASPPAAAPIAVDDPRPPGDAVDRLVDDVCDRSLVLLGEDLHHGSGATVSAKVRIVEQLVDRCGFSALLFEGQVYDFLALERAVHDGTATTRMLSDTVGGLWSPTADFQPLVGFLLERWRAGRIVLGGVDPQLGGASQRYSQQRLAADLVRLLDEPAKSTCAARISRLANWQFDSASPYDDGFRDGIGNCIRKIVAAAGHAGDQAAGLRFMAENLGAYLDMSGDDASRRDQAMADNVLWYRRRLPVGTKVIVWCASVHAATRSALGGGGRQPMGAFLRKALGSDVAAIGFVAASGAYGNRGRPSSPIPVASPPLLEATMVGSPVAMRYLDKRGLAASGTVPSRALDYAHPVAVDWSTIFDGILMLREEHPMRAIESSPVRSPWNESGTP